MSLISPVHMKAGRLYALTTSVSRATEAIKFRALSTATSRPQERAEPVKDSKYPSFSKALFSGQLRSNSIHPYPQVNKMKTGLQLVCFDKHSANSFQVLTTDAKDTLQALVDPVTKFFQETNDAGTSSCSSTFCFVCAFLSLLSAAKNDDTSSVPPEITQALRDMGAFGLQVPESLGGIGLTNTGCVRATGHAIAVSDAPSFYLC
jgi:hypothetical protein